VADDEARPVPPYASFTTVRNLIERMEREGVPSRLDASYLVGMAGGTRNQVKHALRSLGLIEEDGRVTSRLAELAKRPDERPALLGQLLQERYPSLTSLDQDATKGQLDEVLKTYGLNGATVRKAASFFLAAAMYADLPLSPHLTPSRTRGGGGGPSGTRKQGARRGKGQQRTNTGDGTSTDMKRVYFDLLVSKAEDSDELDSDLLDRIERLVGLSAAGGGTSQD